MTRQLTGHGLIALVTAFCCLLTISLTQAEKPAAAGAVVSGKSSDVLTLLGEGKLAAQLSARGAYQLNVRMKNLTNEVLDVQFPPGLVADAFAQNQILYQLQGTGNMQPTNSDGTQGSQGMGMLESSKSKFQPGQTQEYSFRTACLNFGVPEPRADSWLYFKLIEDYSPSQQLHAVLKEIAQQKIETPVAQAALWNLANGLSWREMAGQHLLGGGSLFTPVQLRKSQEFVATTLADAAQRAEPVVGTQSRGRGNFASFAMAVNPDPRGTVESAPLVCQAVFKLRAAYPQIAFSHANYPKPAPDLAKPFVQWGVLVQSGPRRGNSAAACSLLFTFARSEWDLQQKAWRYDPPTTSTVAIDHGSANATFLADRLVAELASRTVAVQLLPGKKPKLAVVSALPAQIRAITLRDSGYGQMSLRVAGRVPAGAKTVIDLTDEQAKQLNSISHLTVSSFELGDS
jgi:hypothetical protein